jgi:CHAT domain-containing protein
VEQSVYDLAIDFALLRKEDPLLAFDYSEQSRARSLRDAMHQSQQVAEVEDRNELRLATTSNPRPLSEIQHRLPAQAQIVQYAVLEDKLLIWVASQTNVTCREVPLSSRALGEKVSEYLKAVNRPSTDMASLEAVAKELHKLLITPIEPLLDKTKLVCLVPDKILHYLPFGALISETTGRYLVEDLLLEVSPSSSIFIDCSITASQKAGRGNERLLSVGDPSFDPQAFPTLQRLASARREAKAVAAYYSPSARLLLAEDATERSVRSEILKANVVHFAIHYLPDERNSTLSEMVLASPPGVKVSDKEDDGVWKIHEIYKMKLPQMRLVVLAACQTGIEHQYGGEGAVSVARPFIAAGVPLVVATLWPVDSDASEQLMVSFHRYRRLGDGLSTVEALQRAQLDLLRGEDSRYHHPYYWAAFTALGGYAEY